MNSEFYDGMIAYEQICEEILVKLGLDEHATNGVQGIFDLAQKIFEKRYGYEIVGDKQ